jgi:hypothetical protein
MMSEEAPVAVEFSIAFSRFGVDGLRVHVTGPRSLESTIAYWEAIARRIAKKMPKWLLVIDDMRGKELSPAQWNELVQSMVGRGLEDVRIAHVKQFGLDHIEYCELYANIAGFTARAFKDEGEARRWLRYGEGGPDVRPPPLQWAREPSARGK